MNRNPHKYIWSVFHILQYNIVCYIPNVFSGFKALLRYEGFDNDTSKDFWCNLGIPEIHPVGWCASSNKPLVPPKSQFLLFIYTYVCSNFFILFLPVFGSLMNQFPISFLAIQLKYSNWKAFLVKRLTGAKTLPADFATKVRNNLDLNSYISISIYISMPNNRYGICPLVFFLTLFPTYA